MNYNIDNQTVIINGSGQSDEVVNILSEVVRNIVNRNLPDKYVSIKLHLKSGKFPVLNIGGNVSFDFRDHDIQKRYSMFKEIKHETIRTFKEFFPNSLIEINIDFSLEPSKFDDLVKDKKFVETGIVSAFYPYTNTELESIELANYIEEEVYLKGLSGKDFQIVSNDNQVIINQVFFRNNEEHLRKYKDIVEEYMNSNFDSNKNLIINPEFEALNNVRNNKFGSMVFHNESGTNGVGNDYYGFYSPQRPSNLNPSRGLNVYHPNIILYNEAFNRAKELYEESGSPIQVSLMGKMGNSIDDFEEIIKWL